MHYIGQLVTGKKEVSNIVQVLAQTSTVEELSSGEYLLKVLV